VESLLQDCCSFSWQKKATNPDSYRDSFFALEKRNKTKKLGTDLPAGRQVAGLASKK